MLTALTTALLLAATAIPGSALRVAAPAAAPVAVPGPPSRLSLAAELARPAAAPPAIPPQGTQTRSRPRGFVAIGAHLVETDLDSPFGDDPNSDEGLSLDLGFYSWNASLGLALELGYMVSSYDIRISSLADDEVDVTRYLLGVRLTDDDPESLFVYHLRGGLVLREDDGDVLDDDGSGWYVGGGFEWRLPAGFSVGPSLLYSETDVLDATEWLLGLHATYSF